MKYEIRSRNFDTILAMRTHIHRRLDFALSRFSDRIRKVIVRIEDMNGPKGGIDKKLHVLAYLNRSSPVSLEDRGADFYSLVDCVAGRLGRAVGRTLDRRNAFDRRTNWRAAYGQETWATG